VRETPPVSTAPKRAAVAVILYDGEVGAEVLLMTRATRDGDPWSGHVSLPGGRESRSDADLLATAVRETHEEVGVCLSERDCMGRLEHIGAMSRGGPAGLEVVPYVFWTDETPKLDLGPEAEDAFWFPLERAADGHMDGGDSFSAGGREMELPCWRFKGQTIWGLTHRILSRVLALAAR